VKIQRPGRQNQTLLPCYDTPEPQSMPEDAPGAPSSGPKAPSRRIRGNRGEIYGTAYLNRTLRSEGRKDRLADAQHIAVATVARVDVLVSWNFRHIVNLDRIDGFNAVNLRGGYPLREIRSPREV